MRKREEGQGVRRQEEGRRPKEMIDAKEIAKLVAAALLWLTMFIGITLMSAYMCGCSPTGARKALVTTTAGVKAFSVQHMPAICDKIEKTCKTNPCPSLDKCHKAEKLITKGAKFWGQGAVIVNEVIPDE